MQYDDALSDNKAIERSSDALPPSWANLEEAISHCSRVRHAEVWPELHQELGDPGEVGQYTDRPFFNLGFHSFMKIFDGVVHALKEVSIVANLSQLPFCAEMVKLIL